MKLNHQTLKVARMLPVMISMIHATVLGEEKPGAIDTQIQAENARFAELYNRGDIEAISHLYTDEAKLLPEGSEAVKGRENIKAFLQKIRTATWPDTIVFTNFEVFSDGKTATEVSDMHTLDKDGKVTSRGKQMLLFLKKGDKWLLHRDIWTDNGPVSGDKK